jgi:hypothetical protein
MEIVETKVLVKCVFTKWRQLSVKDEFIVTQPKLLFGSSFVNSHSRMLNKSREVYISQKS